MASSPIIWTSSHQDDSTVAPDARTPASPVAKRSRARSISRAIWALLVGLSLFVIGIEYWSRSLAYDNQIRQSTVAGQNIAQASIDHLDSTLDTVTWMLDGLVEQIETEGASGAAGERLRRYLLTRVRKAGSPLQGLFIYDRKGAWLLATVNQITPGANNAHRAYFARHRDNPDRGAYVGPPVLSHSSGQWILTVSQRLNDREGNFAGVVLATIPVSYFQQYYERMSLGRHGTVLLALNDGTVVTRTPSAPGVTGMSVRDTPLYRFLQEDRQTRGSVMLMTQFDQVERLHSFRRSADYPLFVNAALSKDEFLADWWRVTVQECTAVAAMMIGVYVTGFWLIAQIRIRERLEGTLRSAQATLETQNAMLARLAHTDGLTGLHNRRSFDERLAAEAARAARDGSELCLVMIDVDFFKRYNDTYGHAAGDDCLRTVASVLAATVNRPADLAARFGGEEFAVLLPNTTHEGARAVAEAICLGIRAKGLEHRASAYGILTISAGVASTTVTGAKDTRAFLEAADRALYLAKAAGRDTVRTC